MAKDKPTGEPGSLEERKVAALESMVDMLRKIRGELIAIRTSVEQGKTSGPSQ